MKTKDKPLNLKKLESHPLCAAFPPMNDEEYSELKKGMKENGFDKKHPIVLFEGQILDGAHRYSCAKDTRKEPEFIEFEKLDFAKNGGSPFDFVIQENLRRRNLTPSVAAALGAEMVEMMEKKEAEEKARFKEEEKAAKAAAKAAGKPAGKKKSEAPKPTNKAKNIAKTLGVSERSVRKAAALKRKDPAAFQSVKSGEQSVGGATEQTEVKVTKEMREKGVLSAATANIDAVLGQDWSIANTKNLRAKEIIDMSGLDPSEMRRIKPLIEAGWKLKASLGYQSTQLTMAHPMRQFVDRALAQGGTFLWEGVTYGKTFEVEIKEKK